MATSGAYADLSGTPTLGSAAAEDVGTGAGNVVQLVDVGGVVKLPALDGSQLVNVPAVPAVYERKTASFTASVGYHYSVDASGGAVVATLPARSGVTAGYTVTFKLYNSANTLTLTPAGSDLIDGASSLVLSAPKESINLINGQNDWEVM